METILPHGTDENGESVETVTVISSRLFDWPKWLLIGAVSYALYTLVRDWQ